LLYNAVSVRVEVGFLVGIAVVVVVGIAAVVVVVGSIVVVVVGSIAVAVCIAVVVCIDRIASAVFEVVHNYWLQEQLFSYQIYPVIFCLRHLKQGVQAYPKLVRPRWPRRVVFFFS
jgi:hypothetical protein